MQGTVYTVHVNAEPHLLGDIAMQTFQEWVDWALGETALGGKKLRYPSGRYASGIKLTEVDENTYEIWVDESEIPYATAIEYGHAEIMMRNAILYGAKSKNVKTSKRGTKYKSVFMAKSGGNFSSMLSNVPGSQYGQVSAQIRALRNNNGEFRTVSSDPTKSSWIIPAMTPYAPAAILAKLIEQKYGAGNGKY